MTAFLHARRFAHHQVGLCQKLQLVKKWHVAPLRFIPAYSQLLLGMVIAFQEQTFKALHETSPRGKNVERLLFGVN